MAVIRIVVPGDTARTSQNQRLHWRELARRVKAAMGTARLCWVAAGRPTATGRVRVSVIVRRGRRMDEQNVWGALKPHMDGIFREGVTPDDSARFVTLGAVTQETGRRWKDRPEVEFVVEEVDCADA